MQTHHIARLTSMQQVNTMRRSLSKTTVPVLRKLIQSGKILFSKTLNSHSLCITESSHPIVYVRPSYAVRCASTTSSNDEQNQNEEKKKNMTNLLYLAGALTGVGAIYSLVCR